MRLRTAGLIALALCSLTLLCSDGDAHPSDAGYSTIADLNLDAARL